MLATQEHSPIRTECDVPWRFFPSFCNHFGFEPEPLAAHPRHRKDFNMKKVRGPRPLRSLLSPLAMFMSFSLLLLLAGCGTIGPGETTTTAPTVSITASPASVTA